MLSSSLNEEAVKSTCTRCRMSLSRLVRRDFCPNRLALYRDGISRVEVSASLVVVFLVLFKVNRQLLQCLTSVTMFPSQVSKFRTNEALAFTSLLCLSLVLITYIVLPKPSNSNMQKISLTISVFILTSVKCFTMFQSSSLTFCQNAIQGATFHNPRCGIQAFILALGVHSTLLWASIRAYTVLALITYQRSLSNVRWTVGTNAVCWGVPLLSAVGTIGSQTVGYSFSGSCGPNISLQIGLILVPAIVSLPNYFI